MRPCSFHIFSLAHFAVPLIISATLLAMSTACSSTKKADGVQTVEDVFREAMIAFEDGNWMEATAKLDIIKLQYPASPVADDAQFYLAEINYKRGEFILAAFNYQMVRRQFPNSDYAKPALLKAADCYYQLAPPPDRDQEYTNKAIQAYSEFQAVFPTDSLALVALGRIQELRSRLAQKLIDAATHYVNTRSLKSALVYYDAVVTEYADTPIVEDALVGKLGIFVQQKKIDEARGVIATYKKLVRSPNRLAEFNELAQSLR
jgi:outer membrane protein assembly factor BamD